MSYTYYIYKTWEKVKSKYTMRICSLREHRLKHEWNQMVWSVNNLRCGTAAARAGPSGDHEVLTALPERIVAHPEIEARNAERRSRRVSLTAPGPNY